MEPAKGWTASVPIYVGQTEKPLSMRFPELRLTIRNVSARELN
jgi:hypothetical protein